MAPRWTTAGRSRRPSPLAAGLAALAVALGVGVPLLASGQAEGASPAATSWTVNTDLITVIKYYEGIPTTPSVDGDHPADSAQSPSLTANRACLYNDGDPSCWSPGSAKKGNCTIGWGHLFYPPHLCADEKSTFPDGMTLGTANIQLIGDLTTKVALIDKCLGRLPFTQGEFRSLVSLVYQHGSPLIGNTCHGEVTEALLKPKANIQTVLVSFLQQYHGSFPSRGPQEIWDATGGKQGTRPDAIWDVATAVQPRGAPGSVTITPTGAPDQLAGVTPKKTMVTCASAADPAKKCGLFYPGEQVDIKASTENKDWQFVGWAHPADATSYVYQGQTLQARDLCVPDFQHSATCTVNVQDQLVRAIAMFRKLPCAQVGRPRTPDSEASGCGSRTGTTSTTEPSRGTRTTGPPSPTTVPPAATTLPPSATTSSLPVTTTTNPECVSVVTCPPVGVNLEVDGDLPGEDGAGDEWGIGIVTYSSEVPVCPDNGETSTVPCMQPLDQTLTAPFPDGSWAAQFNDKAGCVNGYDAVGVCYPVWPEPVTVTFTAHAVPVGGESTGSSSPDPDWATDFVGWGGACSKAGKSPTCTLDLSSTGEESSPADVVAEFAATGTSVSTPA